MDIKDLAGLSQPLTKLVETISQGIGAISAPMLIRKTADAKAYEIKAIAAAVAESRRLLTDTSYHAGEVSVISTPEDAKETLAGRAQQRLNYQDAKKQMNIESVTEYAAEEVSQSETVSTEPVDSDWTSRFFSIAQDITTDEMQRLWGRILAGEVLQPGTFSLWTFYETSHVQKLNFSAELRRFILKLETKYS